MFVLGLGLVDLERWGGGRGKGERGKAVDLKTWGGGEEKREQGRMSRRRMSK